MGKRHICGATEAAPGRAEFKKSTTESRRTIWKIKDN